MDNQTIMKALKQYCEEHNLLYEPLEKAGVKPKCRRAHDD